jgi:hypothetical protein
LTWRSPDKFGKGSGEVVRITGHAVRWRLLTELADSDYRIRGLVTRVDQPQNLISYHLRLLRDGGLVISHAQQLRRPGQLLPPATTWTWTAEQAR